MTSLSTENKLALLSTSFVAYESHHARVLLKGPDAKSFLHRLSTNAVESLQKGASCLNILTNQKGRVVDLLHQLIVDDDQVLILGSPGRAREIITWLDQFLFVEQVELIDLSEQGSVAWVIGAEAASILPDRLSIPSFHFVDNEGRAVPSFLVCDFDANGVTQIDDDTFACARIAAGIPTFPNEINDAYNPLELGLRDAIHWAKGCYIGQEVISRLDTYQKLSRKLIKVHCPAQHLPLLQVGQAIVEEGQVIGSLTSISPHFWPNHANALAVIKGKSDVQTSPQLRVQTDSQLVEISF